VIFAKNAVEELEMVICHIKQAFPRLQVKQGCISGKVKSTEKKYHRCKWMEFAWQTPT